MELLGLGDIHTYDTATAWRPRPARDRLRVPIGIGDSGGLVHLDIKESAQQGMGPHGLVIGATGSGKSEFLRTLVLGLTMTHSSEQLNLVLVDFKGGATFAGMADMPHVSAVITNLANELTLVDRMQDALSGEMTRRQELLRDAGNYASIRDYEKARANGEDLAPMPSLFIVVDEFSEMLSAKPEFIDLFVAIGRLGRSLGPAPAARLATPRGGPPARPRVAPVLPRRPAHLLGRGVPRRARGPRRLRAARRARPGLPQARPVDAAALQGGLRLRAAVGPVARPPRRGRPRARHPPYTISEVQALEPLARPTSRRPRPPASSRGSSPRCSTWRCSGWTARGCRAHQVWLPPLDVPDTLDELMPDLVEDPDLGLVSPRWRDVPGLVVPLGTVDRPREQRRDTMTLNLTGASRPRRRHRRSPLGQEHAAAHHRDQHERWCRRRGSRSSSSSTSVAARSRRWPGFPHVSGVATRSEPDVVRRVIAEVQGVVDRREAYFRHNGIDSIETYRSRRAQGRADDGWGDVFLVVDGWSTLRAEFDDIEMEIQQLAGRGLTFGIHIIDRLRPVGRLPGRDARRLRLQARAAPRRPARLRGRPQGRGPGADRSPRSWPGAERSCTSWPHCRASTGTPTPAPSATVSTT